VLAVPAAALAQVDTLRLHLEVKERQREQGQVAVAPGRDQQQRRLGTDVAAALGQVDLVQAQAKLLVLLAAIAHQEIHSPHLPSLDDCRPHQLPVVEPG
jgi:hypothetical protein